MRQPLFQPARAMAAGESFPGELLPLPGDIVPSTFFTLSSPSLTLSPHQSSPPHCIGALCRLQLSVTTTSSASPSLPGLDLCGAHRRPSNRTCLELRLGEWDLETLRQEDDLASAEDEGVSPSAFSAAVRELAYAKGGGCGRGLAPGLQFGQQRLFDIAQFQSQLRLAEP